jgi:hypothetical protein
VDSLTVRVINPLKVTDGNPTTIQILIFVSAGPDFSTVAPRDPSFAYFHSGSNTLADEDPDPIDNRPDARVISLLPTASVSTVDDATVVNGEVVLSLRPWLTRFTPIDSFQSLGRQYDLRYFGPVATTSPYYAASYYYQYFRGSTRYKFFVRRHPLSASGSSPTTYSAISSLTLVAGSVPSPPTNYVPTGTPTNQLQHITFPPLNPVHEISVPYFTTADRLFINEDFTIQPSMSVLLVFYFDYDTSIYTTPPLVDTYISLGEDALFLYPGGCRNSS